MKDTFGNIPVGAFFVRSGQLFVKTAHASKPRNATAVGDEQSGSVTSFEWFTTVIRVNVILEIVAR